MIEFYTISWIIRIFITFLLGICVLFQTLAIVLNFYRHDQSTQRILGNLFEIIVLVEILIFSLLYGEVVDGYNNGILVAVGYENIRMAIFLTILILALGLVFSNKSLLPINVIIATTILLPLVEDIVGYAFPWLFITVLIFFLVRSIRICASSLTTIKTSISALSIVHAVDTLPTGVLFCESDGYTVLSNYQMQNLMLLITGKVFRDAVEFYQMLVSDKYKSEYKKMKLEGQIVYLLPDNTAWIFTKTEIPFQMKNYIHISAADVSENWALTAKLQDQDQQLRKKSIELKNTISNLHLLSKEKELESARMRAHDILGQRLTLLLRMIQNEDNLDFSLLTSLSKGLLDELKAEHNEKSALDELKSIQQIFASIGVDINFRGKLPDNEDKARLFVDIIREGSTNAVRHGLATQVNIESEKTEDLYNLEISNIGHATSDQITPGSGLKTLRKKVSSQGGKLEIIPYPQFTLSVVLPGGDKSGTSTNCRRS